MKALFPFFALLLLASCHREPFPMPQPGFEPGVLLVGMNEDVSLEQAFGIFNDMGLSIQRVRSLEYASSLPSDSVAFINHELEAKPYILKEVGVAAYANNVQGIVVQPWLMAMDVQAQRDWLATVERLQLSPWGNRAIAFTIDVPPGEENVWIEILLSHPSIQWAQLNHYWTIY